MEATMGPTAGTTAGAAAGMTAGTIPVEQTPAARFFFDLNRSPFFVLDACNYINILGANQLNTLKNISLLDVYMSAGHVIEPHYHQNAEQLVYCISGSVTVSILNPFTRQLQDFPLSPGQVANVPRGWWHYEIANVNNTHLLAIFDAPNPEVILGSDILTLTPPQVFAQTYGINETAWQKVIAPVHPATFIGPWPPGQQPVVQPVMQSGMPGQQAGSGAGPQYGAGMPVGAGGGGG